MHSWFRNLQIYLKLNKSPRGLNAHLNWRKLPVVHLGVCHQLEKLWGPSPPWSHVYHLNNSESPTPKDVFWIRWNSYFLGPLPEPITPPPPPPPRGHCHWGHPGNCHELNNFNSSHKKVFEYYITWLLHVCMFWPLGALSLGSHGGHMYHMKDFESPAPKDDSCQVCLNSTKHFQEVCVDEINFTFYIGPPPQPVTPTGAIGATLGTAMNNLYSSPKKVYTHCIPLLFYLNWI